jgi:hypothetical protein
MQISLSWKSPCSCQRIQHFSWPLFYLLRTASIWRGLFRKERQLSNSCYKAGILASMWLGQRPLPQCLIPAQHRANILQCPQEVCAMVGHGWGSDHDIECMAIRRLLNMLHLADIITVQRRVLATILESYSLENTRNASEYLRGESTTIERTAHPTYVLRSLSEGRVSSNDECDWHSECSEAI